MPKSQLTHPFWRRGARIIIGLAIIMAVAIGVRQITRGPTRAVDSARHAGAAVPVTASIATRKDVPKIINAIGTVQSIDSVSIQPRVTGTIEKIEFAPGQDVRKGQELFLIDPRPYQAALDQAKAQLAHDEGVLTEAEVDLKRYQGLERQHSIASQTAQDQAYVVEQDKGTVELDRAAIETAQLNLDYCHIRTPISGRAGTLQVDLGNLVGPGVGLTGSAAGSAAGSRVNGQTSTAGSAATVASGGALVTIVQLQPIYVTFTVPQTELDQVIRNQTKNKLEVTAYSQAGKRLGRGKLAVIDNQVSTVTGTATLQAKFANADEALWPGEYVSVQLVVKIRHDVVTVPASAVMAGPNGDYVYVIDAHNTVKRVSVQQAARLGGISVISNGISAGEKVVATGQYRLDSGTRVAIEQTTVPHEAARATASAASAGAD